MNPCKALTKGTLFPRSSKWMMAWGIIFAMAQMNDAVAQSLIKESFGVTSHLDWVPLDKMDNIKVARTYTSAGTFCRDSQDYMFEPTWQGFHYDRYLEDGKSRGMKFMVCLTNNLPLFAGGVTENEDHPIPPGASKEDPASYVLYARLVFQITARYGSKTVDDSLLKVKEFPAGHYQRQTKRSGTGLVYGIEIWNEANKWGGNFTPKEYYALLSACYDGHKGTLGVGAGAMQADPDMNIFFTGTSDHTPTYHTAVRDIWVQERGEPFPENIIYNFHGYFHNKAINNNNRTTGIAPELGDATTIYRNWASFAGNNRVAKTEYGYDTNPVSIQHAPTLSKPDSGTYSLEEAQAALILRDFHLQSLIPQMCLSIFYHVRDKSWSGSTLQYSTSGITYSSSFNYAPKESYFIISGFIELSDGFYNNGTLLREEPYIVRYTGNGKYLYAVWTHSKTKFTIDAETTDDTISVVIPTKNGNSSSKIVPVNNMFSVEAQQMPVYFITDSLPVFKISACDSIKVFDVSICNGDSVLINGIYRKYSGIYFDTLAGYYCDSIVRTNLTSCEQSLSGVISTEAGTPIPNVSVKLSGSETDSMFTSGNGSYMFVAANNGNYTIAPFKNNDNIPLHGISTIDMAKIQRHILQIEALDSPYKIIAADINGSGTISTTDLIMLRAFILGNISLPNGELWKFVKSDFQFPDPGNPFPFESSKSYSNLSQSYNQNFIGVKMGDVNGSWTAY